MALFHVELLPKITTMTEQDIVRAWARIRAIDSQIPDEVLDLMKDAAIQALNKPEQAVGNELLRSFYAIAEREGESTNWEALKKHIKAALNGEPQPEVSLLTALELVSGALSSSDQFKLQVEIIASAFIALKRNPSLTIEEALQEGLNEWDV